MVDKDTPPDPPHENYPDDWTTSWRMEDGELVPWGTTDRGNDFRLNAGSTERVEDRCGAPLRDYERRYGEVRYCTKLSANNFPGYETDYCKTHRFMDDLKEHAREIFEHGHFAATYIHFAKKLSPTKFLFAVEMVGGLFEMSQYDFDIVEEEVKLDTSNSELIEDEAVTVDLPIPQSQVYSFQADQLWQAALAEVEMRNMREAGFEDNLVRDGLAASADSDGTITDTITEEKEHHLHLPISRLTKDIKEHLKNGGVAIEADDGGVVTFEKNDYTLDVTPDDDASDAEPVHEVGESFSEKLTADDDTAVVEIED